LQNQKGNYFITHRYYVLVPKIKKFTHLYYEIIIIFSKKKYI